jgi:hypothetical protein
MHKECPAFHKKRRAQHGHVMSLGIKQTQRTRNERIPTTFNSEILAATDVTMKSLIEISPSMNNVGNKGGWLLDADIPQFADAFSGQHQATRKTEIL